MLSKITFDGINLPIDLIPEKFHLHLITKCHKLKVSFSEYYKYTLYFCDYNDIIYGKEVHYKNYQDFNYFIILKNKKTSNIHVEYMSSIEIPFEYKNNITIKSIESFEQNSIDIKYDIYDFVISCLNYSNIYTSLDNKKKILDNNNLLDSYNSLNNSSDSINSIDNKYPIDKKIFLGIGGEYYFYWSNISKKYDKYIGITNNDFIYSDAKLNSNLNLIQCNNYKVEYKNISQLFSILYYKLLSNIYVPSHNNYKDFNNSIKVYNYKIDLVINLFKIYKNIFRIVNLLIKLKLLDTLVIISCKDFDLNKINFKNNMKKHDIRYFNSDTTLVKVYVLYF